MAKRGLILETSIAELSPGGDGVAICEIDAERRAVFVGGVVRGERVRVEVDDGAQRPARGRLLAVLEPSPARAVPACAHVATCGGCDWMHLTLAEQAEEHGRIVDKLLRIDASSASRTKHHVAVAASGIHYRTRARLHVVGRRGRVVVGMFGRRSHEPVGVDTCVVLDPVLDRARERLAGWLEGADGHGEARLSLGAVAACPAPAAASRLAVLDLRWRGGAGEGSLPPAVFGRLERAVLDGGLAGARVFAGDVRVPAKIGDPTPYIAGADGEPLRLAPGGFSQTSEAGNALLAGRVAELARTLEPGPCVELHAGAGNHTVLLARDRRVTAVERDADACAAAKANLEARGLSSRVRIVEGDAATFAIAKGTKLVVLDPPREGARDVAVALAGRSVHHKPDIVYVSCDPATLTRDVRTLEAGGYGVRVVETFEMFPQTSHVETVVVLTAEPGAARAK